MAMQNRVLFEAQRNLSNVILFILKDSKEFKSLFVGKDYKYDPTAISVLNLEQFATELPAVEPHLNYLLSNLGLGGKHRIRMLKTSRQIREICNRPKWLITEATWELLRVLISNLGSAISGAISQTAFTRDDKVIDISAKMTKDVSLQDVTRASIDIKPDTGADEGKPKEEKDELSE